VRERLRSPWVLAAALGAWQFAGIVAASLHRPLERFDEGITVTASQLLARGLAPHVDYYVPYGVGYGLPGLPAELLGFDGVLALRLVYGLFCVLATMLLVVFVARRAGLLVAALVGVAALPALVPRYSMGWVALLGAVLVLERAPSLREGRPRTLLAVSLVLSLAAWARVEYALFGAIWAVLLVAALPRRDGLRQAAAALALAALPTVLILVGGHVRDFIAYLDYSASDFRFYRGLPPDWSFPLDWIVDVVTLRTGTAAAAEAAFYGVMAVVLVAWLATVRRAPDPRRVTALLVLCGAFVLLANTVRFGPDYSLLAVPVGWAAAVAVARGRAARIAIGVAAGVLAVQTAGAFTPWSVADRLTSAPDQGFREPAPRLNRIPLNEQEWPALAALPVLWETVVPEGSPVLSVSRRNDVAVANDTIVYPLLDAEPAAWPVTYDPGLVTRDDVQRRAVEDLCERRAPVVQLAGDYPGVNGRERDRPGSRRLDQVLAYAYELRAVAGFYRVLAPVAGCVQPEAIPEDMRVLRRDQLLALDDLPAAGALAVLGLERGGGDPDDVATAVLGGYAVDPALLGDDAGLKTLASGELVPGTLAAAAAPGSAHQRLARQSAWIAQREPGSPEATDAAVQAMRRLAFERPQWPQAVRNLSAVLPYEERTWSQLAAKGYAGTPLHQWRFDERLKRGAAPEELLEAALALISYMGADPVAEGAVEVRLADALDAAGERDCAAALRHRANARPGVKVVTAPAAPPPCPLLGG
jgi:hypothetical protein